MKPTIETWKLHNEDLDENIKVYIIKAHTAFVKRLSLKEKLNETYFNRSFELLWNDNHDQYKELNEGYMTSYANPDYAAKKLPESIVGVCSWLYYEILMLTPAIFQDDQCAIERTKEYFFSVSSALQKKDYEFKDLQQKRKDNIGDIIKEDLIQNYSDNFYSQFHKINDFNDLRYLFRYGVYVSKNEVASAQIMMETDDDTILRLAETMVHGYLGSFKNKNKIENGRTCSRVIQIMGLEKITHKIIEVLQDKRQYGIIAQHLYRGCNPQAIYDHRQDEALFITKDYMEYKLNSYIQNLTLNDTILRAYLGNIILVSFGQHKLDLTQTPHATHFSEEQNHLIKEFELASKIAFEKHVPKSEISYTGMAFPVQEIHSDYKKVFQHIIEINLMDSKTHEDIQELLIQELDQGEYVRIIGYRGNETDIRVSMQKMKDPSKETNFVNCGADVNHPVGEVFTSPKLEGTKGILHIKQARISKIAFHDMRITFEDGFVKDYACANFEDEQKNRDLMDEVILHHRTTLPMGEFALGTNTHAYALAKEDGILYKLHTLIFEKLGPHIAIGDTCFAWSEDTTLISAFSGKEVRAKDNSVSMLRTQDLTKAYMGVHYDLTIPYDEIYSLYVHRYDGTEVELVHEGRFVLSGCEFLNKPLDGLKQ